MCLSLGLLAALAFAVPSFGAASTDTIGAQCTVSGTADTTGVDIEPNTGTYSFSNAVGSTTLDLLCVAHDATTKNEVEVVDLATTSAGSFNNTQCGTGTADSTNKQNSVTATQVGGNANLHQFLPTTALGYHIDFTAGQGQLFFTDAQIKNYKADTDADGTITISATGDRAGEADGTKTVCTDHFSVAGNIQAAINGSIL